MNNNIMNTLPFGPAQTIDLGSYAPRLCKTFFDAETLAKVQPDDRLINHPTERTIILEPNKK